MPDALFEDAADVPWPDTQAGSRARAAADARLGGLLGVIEWLAGTGAAVDRPRLIVVGKVAPAVATQAADAGCPITAVAPTGYADGARSADLAVDAGSDVILLAVPDAADTAAVLASVLTGTEPVKVLPRGAGAADHEQWMARAVAVRDTRHGLLELRSDPRALLDKLDDPAIATAAGVALRAAGRRTPVVLDGAAAAAAALLAFEVQPRGAPWWAAADVGQDPAHLKITTTLGLRTLLGLGVDAADGTAALLALDVLRVAAQRMAPAPGGADGG